ncbi:hypothetical protein GLAREA_08659 [Glarea lozoyensis ATCC 20868]|uniref:Aminoglycoside phosphotransferase domain-containing protein n=1 Tax=Glarea lozoyensis (strain ATCC 20868 / MF5171) TaxID=1116229 RepID=S3DX11_GLAL2|nr:uncharacterized protein GLAREA_08659 [Glarea lozoyensis ATCC 20868]EPE36496.1 hypothetical protein GLAREA_08659 [Glarea lozoyensis ATCC 20868]
MVITIESNADMPMCLGTEAKQLEKARELAEAHYNLGVEKSEGVEVQGFYSRTFIVTLQDKMEVVIQFRPEPLDLAPFKLARKTLGDVVPEIELLSDKDLEKEKIWTFCMTKMPGRVWLNAIGGPTMADANVSINKSLGRIFSQGYIEGESTEMVERDIRPHLEMLVASENSAVRPFRDVSKEFLRKLDTLKVLPLFVSHFSLSQLNILVDENHQVSGIVDWELSQPLPFGMGFARIHTLAGEYRDGEFEMPEKFEDAERGFWDEVFKGLTPDVRDILGANLEAIQMAVWLGTLLDTFHVDAGQIGNCNPVTLRALPKFLSYRLPSLRGLDPPYSN